MNISHLGVLATKARDLVKTKYANLDFHLFSFIAIFSLLAMGLHSTHPLNPQCND